MENLTIYCWAGPKERRPTTHAQATPAWPRTARPRLAPASAAATDKGDPRVSERNRGREEDDGATRRRWHLRRDHRCYCVCLTHVHLVVPSIDAIVAARGNGDGHGGARPWHDRLRRDDCVSALTSDSTSFGSVHRT